MDTGGVSALQKCAFDCNCKECDFDPDKMLAGFQQFFNESEINMIIKKLKVSRQLN